MKKYINVIFVFVMLLFIPLGVNAENTCDASKVTVQSIELVSKTDNVEENNNPEVDTNNLLMDLKMSEVEDSITYKIIINTDPDEDFKLNTKSLSLSGNYLDYEIEFENESVIKKNEDNVILLISLIILLAIIVMDIINTFVSKTKGSTFIKPLAFDDDKTVNTKFIVFCYIFGAISIGVIVYFILILCGMELFFSTFPRPLAYLIINLFSLTLLACIAIIVFPYVGTSDISFQKKNRR